MEQFMVEALRTAILTEKKSHDFYKYAAQLVSNSRVRDLFDFLAKEEVVHLQAFYEIFPENCHGDIQSLMKQPINLDNPIYQALMDEVDIDTRERQALEISLREERACIDNYTIMVGCFREPQMRGVFKMALNDTYKHYKIIQKEYMRAMWMVEWLEQVNLCSLEHPGRIARSDIGNRLKRLSK